MVNQNYRLGYDDRQPRPRPRNSLGLPIEPHVDDDGDKALQVLILGIAAIIAIGVLIVMIGIPIQIYRNYIADDPPAPVVVDQPLLVPIAPFNP